MTKRTWLRHRHRHQSIAALSFAICAVTAFGWWNRRRSIVRGNDSSGCPRPHKDGTVFTKLNPPNVSDNPNADMTHCYSIVRQGDHQWPSVWRDGLGLTLITIATLAAVIAAVAVFSMARRRGSTE
jgi:hypothetical protein